MECALLPSDVRKSTAEPARLSRALVPEQTAAPWARLELGLQTATEYAVQMKL